MNGEGEEILEEIIDYLQKNRTSDWAANLSFLKGRGRVRLLEAGRNLRIYQFVSFDGDRLKIKLFSDGTANYTEII